jgi:hypothetical protein
MGEKCTVLHMVDVKPTKCGGTIKKTIKKVEVYEPINDMGNRSHFADIKVSACDKCGLVYNVS